MASVAGAEPAAKVAGLADWYTAQMRAYAQHDEPLRFLDTVRIRLRVAECGDVHGVSFFDLGLGAVPDEDRFAAPLDDNILAFWDCGEVDFNLGLGEDVGRC